jgi:hypothetical protein
MAAAAPDQTVYSLEHLEHFARQTVNWAEETGLANIGLCHAPLTDECWYDYEAFGLPAKFAFGFCDGPPRLFGTRMKFFDVFAPRCTVVAVDDIKSDINFYRKVCEWAGAHGRTVQVLGRAALILKAPPVAESIAA